MQNRMTKILKWEFWPFSVFYLPVYFYWLYLSARAGSLFFFSAANTKMRLGGFFRYSKYNALLDVPENFRPPMLLLNPDELSDFENLLQKINDAQIGFPLILKPDSGERGKQVSLIRSKEELAEQLAGINLRMIIQGFISEPMEFGVLYYRFPGESSGRITSIVQKEFLSITGNGQSSVRELVITHKRYKLFAEHLEEAYPEKMSLIPGKGEKLLLEPIGNHSRGTIFLNANRLITPELTASFDRIAAEMPDFHFGRFDLRAESEEALGRGEVKIMEVNGANSEPAHIYHPGESLLRAYRDLFRHWKTLYRVSKACRTRGATYTPNFEGLRIMFSERE